MDAQEAYNKRMAKRTGASKRISPNSYFKFLPKNDIYDTYQNEKTDKEYRKSHR